METVLFRFGLYEFNAGSRELRREGASVHLQAQPAQLLCCLLERAGEVVSREELRAALWDSETFVDFDRSLNFCVSQLRAALRDNSAEPVYIRTIPKQGYQFIAPVSNLPESSLDQGSEAEPLIAAEAGLQPQQRRRIPATFWILPIAAVLIPAIVVTWVWAIRRNQQISPPIIAVLRFDNETGDAGMTPFSDALTDTVVVQLTSASRGRYQVIGNALILRTPRDQRDLRTIAASLHASYIVLGQVQQNNGQLRVLAHLIQMPSQTHLWVVRTDHVLDDRLAAQSTIAQRIGAEFSEKISARPVSR